MLDDIDYPRNYSVLRNALAKSDDPEPHVITIPGGRTWALKQELDDEAKELGLLLLKHPKIDKGVTPLDFMGGIGNPDFPYFSQAHEPLIAIAIAIKEGYLKYSTIIGRYVANTANPFVVEYVQDIQNRKINEVF